MKTRVIFLLSIMFVLALSVAAASAVEPPKNGSTLPEMALIKPEDSSKLKYLGLSGSGEFRIDQIKAQAVIIQIFSMYCPYCQKDAPNINRLFNLMENDPRIRGKVKIIGIGAGNSQFEVNTFRKKYAIGFPLLPDPDFKIHKILGEVRTPYFIVVKMNGPKKPEVVYSKLGAHDRVETFLSDVMNLTDLK